MLRVRTLPYRAMGQAAPQTVAQIDVFCAPVSLIKAIPSVGELVARSGCGERGKAAIRAGLATAVGTAGPGAALISQLGAEMVVDCLCKGKPAEPFTPEPDPWWKSPVVLLGLGVAAVGVGYAVMRKKEMATTP